LSISRHGKRKNLRTFRAVHSVCLSEALERRLLFSTITVSTLADTGAGSLRTAITSANMTSGDIINFSNGLTGTINLASALPNISSNTTIDGPGANVLTVNGHSHGSVFSINQGVTAEIENLTITGGSGTAIGGSNYGGGIFDRGNLTVSDSTISGNTASGADGGGGGIYTNEFAGSLAVVDSTISGNTAGYFGGGINQNYGTLTVTDSTITGNSAKYGGGFFGRGAETFTDSTISGNSASSSIGGVEVDRGTLGSYSCTVDGTIIAANTGGDFANTNPSSTVSGSNDLIGDGSDGGVFTSSLRGTAGDPLNPLLGSLANNGGATDTLAILSGSPAISRNAVFAAAGGVDQRGVARFAGSVDIGAYQSSFLAVNTLGDPSTPTAGILSLREAITDANSLGNGRTIEFVSGLSGTINLASALPAISDNTTIDGPGANVLTVNGNSHGSVFSINQGVTAEIENLEITGGSGTSANGSTYGGGIHNLGILTVTDSNITGNTASGGGSGIYSSEFAGSLTVIDSTISGNTGGIFGGGITLNYGTLSVTDSTITGNIAEDGGAFFGRGIESFIDSTISGNLATSTGGVYVEMGTDGPFSTTVDGTIIADNFGGDFANSGSGTATGSNDLIGDGSDGGAFTSSLRGTAASPVNPLLGPLAFNGGPTETMALLTGSPALGTGGSFDGITSDQRGYPRPSGPGIDIGAFQVEALLVNTLGDPSTPTNGILSLREAITDADSLGGAQEIMFAAGLNGTIALASLLPSITTDLDIDGLGVGVLTVNGENLGNVFAINPGVTAEINDLTITGGGITDNGSLITEGNVVTGGITGSGGLTVGEGLAARLTLSVGAGNSTVGSVIVNTNATLDITNNLLAIDFGSGTDPAGNIVGDLTTGYSGGAWNGTGIVSSTAAANPQDSVGYADGNVDSTTAAQPGQFLVEYTLKGDANLDRQVNFADLLKVAQNFNKTGEDWAGGNFIYAANGQVNFADLLAVSQNFNKPLLPAASTDEQIGGSIIPLVSSVPAPAPPAAGTSTIAVTNTSTAPTAAAEPPKVAPVSEALWQPTVQSNSADDVLQSDVNSNSILGD